MAQILMFFSSLIIFLTLFLVETRKTGIRCESKQDCPTMALPDYVTCVEGLCRIYLNTFA
ncbi:putative Late nodulin [Medicago truncatula]|uniref:Putative Late nodulin n=1 Tax=Medicago truncatula TaxID=3880 RepID=A0A396HNF2_MEDTR|nr:putative Late nodulin [Medicago truncatula]